MKPSLIIVESPAKIKTLKKFLGDKKFLFASSVGHIRDLPEKEFGIDIETFEPSYKTLPDKKNVIDNIKKLASQCDTIYLSPDPDREGEAIAWHIASLLPKTKHIQRVTFNAITKDTVLEALKNPQEINMALVNAQQARRLLDRIVGYKLSPILIKKLQQRKGISAGRVQSVALKLIVDREKEIEAFIPKEYWNIKVTLVEQESMLSFPCYIHTVEGKSWAKDDSSKKNVFLIDSEEKANKISSQLQKAIFTIESVDKKEKKRNPPAPFITSTLQQEASRHFRFSSSKTMSVAQTLYEGVEMSSGESIGLITYMRTDSFRVAPEALTSVRNYINNQFSSEYLPNKANVFQGKKSAQDAHEAIRPTTLSLSPEELQHSLTKDQYNLYNLIWRRFIASQMSSAIYDSLVVLIDTNKNISLKASGSSLKFKGFLAIYEEKTDDIKENQENFPIPPLSEKSILELANINSSQEFTKPLPRFTEASLVKELEKSGIGRPSTYAAIMNKIQSRAYTTKENLRLKPTELGRVIAQFLETNFPNIMNIDFTADMEDNLELIADNKKPWKDILKQFWINFSPSLEIAEKEARIPKIPSNLPCPLCKHGLLEKIWSKSHYFYGCSKYPDCNFKSSEEELFFNKDDYDPNTNWNQPCPLCSGEMKIRHGKYGCFLGCLNYPECKGSVAISKKTDPKEEPFSPIDCPAVGCDGKILKRRSRFNKQFFSCSNFPNCNVIANTVEEFPIKYVNHPKTAYQKKSKKPGSKEKKSKTPFQPKETKIPSEPLVALIGKEKTSQFSATKKIWAYIKEHKLQNPKNKREILPNEAFSKLLGSKQPISMFSLAKVIAKNLT